jgi:hypothetical protein
MFLTPDSRSLVSTESFSISFVVTAHSCTSLQSQQICAFNSSTSSSWLLCFSSGCWWAYRRVFPQYRIDSMSGWLLCIDHQIYRYPSTSTMVLQFNSIQLNHLILPVPPHLLLRHCSPSALRQTSWLLCFWVAAVEAAIASTSTHISCAQVDRGAQEMCTAIRPFQWFWWLNRPPRDNCRQRKKHTRV